MVARIATTVFKLIPCQLKICLESHTAARVINPNKNIVDPKHAIISGAQRVKTLEVELCKGGFRFPNIFVTDSEVTYGSVSAKLE